MRERTEKLMVKLDGLDEALKFYAEIKEKVFDAENSEESMMLETISFQPCIGPCICSNIYEECVYPFPEKDAFVQAMVTERGDWDGLKRVYERVGREIQAVSYFQMEGLKEFMETGIIHEFPAGLYRPLPMEKRKLVLGRIFRQIEEGNSVYRVLPANIEIPTNIFFYLGYEKIFFMRVTESGFVQVQALEKRNLFGISELCGISGTEEASVQFGRVPENIEGVCKRVWDFIRNVCRDCCQAFEMPTVFFME